MITYNADKKHNENRIASRLSMYASLGITRLCVLPQNMQGDSLETQKNIEHVVNNNIFPGKTITQSM